MVKRKAEFENGCIGCMYCAAGDLASDVLSCTVGAPWRIRAKEFTHMITERGAGGEKTSLMFCGYVLKRSPGCVVESGCQVRRHGQRATTSPGPTHRGGVASQQHQPGTNRLRSDAQPVHRSLRAVTVWISVLTGKCVLIHFHSMLSLVHGRVETGKPTDDVGLK